MLIDERKLLKRVCALPSDLASAYLEDLEATAKERLALFKSFASKRAVALAPKRELLLETDKATEQATRLALRSWTSKKSFVSGQAT